MGEFVLITLADLRDKEAQEEYTRRHPWRAFASARWRRIAVKVKLKASTTCSHVSKSTAAANCRRLWTSFWTAVVGLILLLTRWFNFRVPHRLAKDLSIQELLLELELREVDHHALEKRELIESLCGPLKTLEAVVHHTAV